MGASPIGRRMVCCISIEDGTRGVKTQLGQFDSMLEPGLSWFVPCCQDVAIVSVRVQQLRVDTQTKTSDNVIVDVQSQVLYQINPDQVADAYFKLMNRNQQITAYVDDEVRSFLPTMTLDEAYENKEDMASAVTDKLSTSMAQYGLIIKKVLITDLMPDRRVLEAMNSINTQKRQRAAAQERAEGEKIMRVKDAEADMEAKHLSGEGVAKMRMAITEGCKESINDMSESVGLAAKDVVHMMLVTQYLDTLKDFATAGRGAVMVDGASTDMESQVRQGFVTGGMLQTGGGGAGKSPPPPPRR